MNNKILSAIALGVLALTSCEQSSMNFNTASNDTMVEAQSENAQIHLNSINYERIVTSPLQREGFYGAYHQGTIEYRESGELSAKVDFGEGQFGKAEKTDKNGNKEELELKKSKEKDSKFEKVIVEPIVKTADCKYIVAGIIEYYKNGELVATIDFGDGSCDDIATKTVQEETTEFSLSDKKDKKDKFDSGKEDSADKYYDEDKGMWYFPEKGLYFDEVSGKWYDQKNDKWFSDEDLKADKKDKGDSDSDKKEKDKNG